MEELDYEFGSLETEKSKYYCECIGNKEIIDKQILFFTGYKFIQDNDFHHQQLFKMQLLAKMKNASIMTNLTLLQNSFDYEIINKSIQNNIELILILDRPFKKLFKKELDFISLMYDKSSLPSKSLIIYTDNNKKFINEFAFFKANLSLTDEEQIFKYSKENYAKDNTFYPSSFIFKEGLELKNTSLFYPAKQNKNKLFKHIIKNHHVYSQYFWDRFCDKKEEIFSKKYFDFKIKEAIENKDNYEKGNINFEVPHFPQEMLEFILRDDKSLTSYIKSPKPIKFKINFYNIYQHALTKAKDECLKDGLNWNDTNKLTGKLYIDEKLEEINHDISDEDYFNLCQNMFKSTTKITKQTKDDFGNKVDNRYAIVLDSKEFKGKIAFQLINKKTKNNDEYTEIIVNSIYKNEKSISQDIEESRKHIDVTDSVFNNTIIGAIKTNYKNINPEYYCNLMEYFFPDYCKKNENRKNEFSKYIRSQTNIME